MPRISAHNAKLQESNTAASLQPPVVSNSEDSECLLEYSPLNPETSSHLAVEPETSVRSDVNNLSRRQNKTIL